MSFKKKTESVVAFKKAALLGLVCWMLIAAFIITCPSKLSGESINVALYPWVPRYDQFQEVIYDAWSNLDTGVELNFVDWDCYGEDPTPELDVFVFDALFLTYFAKSGHLAPICPQDIKKRSDIFEFAKKGCKENGTFYAIPQLACSNFFFCRKDDENCKEYLNAQTLEEMYQLIGDNTSPDIPPPLGEGLLADLSGSTTCACLYVDAEEDSMGYYTPTPPLPPASDLFPDALMNLQLVVRMAGAAQADTWAGVFQRAVWFSNGHGKAMMHYSESIWKMSEETRENIRFKVMPLGSTPVNLFYIDAVGIKPTSDPIRMALTLKLANLITSTRVIVDCLVPWKDDNSPQYILPVRKSIFKKMGKSYKLYRKLGKIIKKCDPKAFRVGEDSKQWLAEQKKAIKQRIYDITEQLKKEINQ
jgi:thiamine pyridinylase